MRALAAFALAAVASCATQGGGSSGVSNVPSAGDGPFRPLVADEVSTHDIAPYVFTNSGAQYRDPSVVAVTSDPASAEVWMYAVATVSGGAVIVRTHATDGRSFYGDIGDDFTNATDHAPTVLQPSLAWEGASLSGPSALMQGGQVILYYAGSGGIGVATSSDGLTFTKTPAPVLTPDSTAAWETTTPHAPAVAVFPDGTWHMLYGAGDSIGEATSSDGMTWTRAAGNPVLGPSPMVDPTTLPAGVPPPFDESRVDDPVMALQTDLDGRLQVRVLYTGYGAPGVSSAIGLAGRYGTSGALSRQATPAYTASLHEAAPAFFEYAGGSLLYVQEDNTFDPTAPFTAVAAGYAPITGSLPSPSAFATSP